MIGRRYDPELNGPPCSFTGIPFPLLPPELRCSSFGVCRSGSVVSALQEFFFQLGHAPFFETRNLGHSPRCRCSTQAHGCSYHIHGKKKNLTRMNMQAPQCLCERSIKERAVNDSSNAHSTKSDLSIRGSGKIPRRLRNQARPKHRRRFGFPAVP